MSEGKIKSVHVTNYYHKNSGGISTSYNNLMDAAARHRRYVRLIVPGETEAVEEVNEFAKIYYVPAVRSPVFDRRYRMIMPWQYMPANTIVRKIMMSEMPQIVEVTDKYSLSFLGRMIRKDGFQELERPALVHFSCERMDDNVASFVTKGDLGRGFARRVMSNYILPSFDFHIANSTYTADEFFQSISAVENPRRSTRFLNWCWQYFAAPRVPLRERVFVCPRGVRGDLYTPDKASKEVRRELCERAGIPKDASVILYAGRISPEKNVWLLLDMMKILALDASRDHRLVIAGDGPLREKLQEHADRDLAGKIVQIGHVERETLAGFYANADVFVHPNPREPFGIAPLEAMASGVPTVAPNSGGILSYASDDNAWLVEPTGDAFAAAVTEVLDNADLRSRRVANALETARENTRTRSTDRLFATYDRIWEDFQSRNDLYTNIAESTKYDFVNGVLGRELSGENAGASDIKNIPANIPEPGPR